MRMGEYTSVEYNSDNDDWGVVMLCDGDDYVIDISWFTSWRGKKGKKFNDLMMDFSNRYTNNFVEVVEAAFEAMAKKEWDDSLE